MALPSCGTDRRYLSKLCGPCQSLCDNYERAFDMKDYLFSHHKTLLDLGISANRGCSLCTQFLRGDLRLKDAGGYEVPFDVSPAKLLSPGVVFKNLDRIQSAPHDPDAEARWPILSHVFEIEPVAIDLAKHKTLKLEAILVPATANDRLRAVDAEKMSNTHDGLRLASQWLRNCQRSHRRCDPRHSTFLPTRLISTERGNQKLCLASDFLRKPDYATLSHCWGTTKFHTLKRNNFLRFRQKIPPEAIPRTLKDAIDTARKLGFQYIWIDTLCIIQDDRQDWEREAAIMQSVYGASSLNIAATRAEDGDSACYVPRMPSWRCRIELQYCGEARLYNVIPVSLYSKALMSTPLNRRAWVLQERLMAPRTLHLSPAELFWECYQNIACESFPRRIPLILTLTCRMFLKQPISRYMWSDIIERYSSSELTYNEDKFIAISGLARVVQDQTNDQYVAGMWRQNLEVQLCWWTALEELAYPSKPWRAPTWSWASRDCPVYDSPMGKREDVTKEVSLWSYITNVSLAFKGMDPLGQLTAAELTLDCPYIARITVQTKYSYGSGSKGIIIVAGERCNDVLCIFDMQESTNFHEGDDAIQTQEAFALPMYSDHSDEDLQVTGIFIEPTGQATDHYIRIGYFYIYGENDVQTFRRAAIKSWEDWTGDIPYAIKIV